MNIQEIRQKYPQYNDLSDQQLADGLHQKFYSDMPREEFDAKIGLLPGGIARPTVDSTMGEWGRVLQGAARGALDVGQGWSQLLMRGLEAHTPAGSEAEQKTREGIAKYEGEIRQGEQSYQQNVRHGRAGFDGPRLIGNIAGTIPLAAAAPVTLLGGGLAGAGAGALQTTDVPEGGSFWEAKAKQVGLGGLLGLGGTAAAKAVSRMVAPKSSPEVQELMQAGVRPTPGQMLGGAAQRVEEGLTSIPLAGDVIRAGQRRAVVDFNRGAINRVLEPIGEKLDGKTLVGREAVAEAADKVGKAYNDLLPSVTFTADMKFLNDVANLQSLTRNMPQATREQFDGILTEQLLKKLNPNTGKMSGETLKEVESELGRLATSYRSSSVASERELGGAITELQATLRETLRRTNPDQAGRLGKINRSYAMLARIEDAASRTGSKEGVFSPAQMTAAVRKGDKSTRKRSFARGDALMQDYAEAGQNVLGPRVPDSGTPLRLMAAGGAMGGVPAAVGALDPVTGSILGAGMLPYTPWGQRAMAHLLGSRPAAAQPVGRAINRISPFVGAASPIVSKGLLD